MKLRAGFEFEHQVLPRWRLAANQLANYMVVTLQITGRKLLGIQHPELHVIREMHQRAPEALAQIDGNDAVDGRRGDGETLSTRLPSPRLPVNLRLRARVVIVEQLLCTNTRTD